MPDDDLIAELLEESRRLGFLGPGPVAQHIAHARAMCCVVSDLVSSRPNAARLADLGVGGGLPGLVLAAELPTTTWLFLDANLRRTTFLQHAVERLGWQDRIEVVCERAEVVGRDPRHRGAFDLVVARSFAAPAVTAECAAPLLVADGCLVVSEPPATDGPERWPAEGVAQFGFDPAEAVEVDGRHFVRLVRRQPCPDDFPRRVGVPAKRPLFS